MSSGDTPAAAATRVLMSFKSASRVAFGRPAMESDVEDNEIVGVTHSDERRRVEKAAFRQLEDQLVEVFWRHVKRIHQGGLDGARYFGDPGLVVTAFDNVDF